MSGLDFTLTITDTEDGRVIHRVTVSAAPLLSGQNPSEAQVLRLFADALQRMAERKEPRAA
jgi:hypothetical protein